MGNPYVGEIRMFGGNFAPVDWALCDGSLLNIADYDTLFVLIGTTYGGDGQSTFALPDLRGRLPIHAGNGPGLSARIQGEQLGNETAALGITQIPNHGHRGLGAASQTTDRPNNAYPARGGFFGPAAVPMPNTQTVGANLPHNNQQPSLAVNFIMSLFGIFPPQS